MHEDPFQTEHAHPSVPGGDDYRAAEKRRPIRRIMLAVVAWGAFLATGMWLSSRNWRGPAVVMACVFAFLAFWAAMLRARRRA